MKLPVVISGLVVSLALVGCSDQTQPASSSEKSMAPATVAPSIAYEDMPPVTEANVTLECAT
ncbi:MAG: hypothetical protein RLZ49_999, partial [Actinomycetota bacterium]